MLPHLEALVAANRFIKKAWVPRSSICPSAKFIQPLYPFTWKRAIRIKDEGCRLLPFRTTLRTLLIPSVKPVKVHVDCFLLC